MVFYIRNAEHFENANVVEKAKWQVTAGIHRTDRGTSI